MEHRGGLGERGPEYTSVGQEAVDEVFERARQLLLSGESPSSDLLQESNIRILEAYQLGDPCQWPLTAEVVFLDDSNTRYAWTSGPEYPNEAFGPGPDATVLELAEEWANVAAINIAEWVDVRSQETWAGVRSLSD